MIASIPAGGVWGWPWHGLATGGAVSGKTITQPPNGQSWLIDIGLPSITLTPAETASASANGYEWRNYALVSGGRVYDTALPANSFIHVDDENKCWFVRLTFTYAAANQIGIYANIKRFGQFGLGEHASVAKSTVVSCEHIEIDRAAGNPLGDYLSRFIALDDVWKNGEKALIGVWLYSSSDVNAGPSDLFSVIEVSITGNGGSDGSGLSLSASEVIGQSELSFKIINPGEWVTGPTDGNPMYSGTNAGYYWIYTPPFPEPCPSGGNRMITPVATPDGIWHPASSTGYGGGFDIITDRRIETCYARSPHYNSAGNARVYRLAFMEYLNHVSTGGTSTEFTGEFFIICPENVVRTTTGFSAYWDVTVSGEQKYGYYLYENDVLIDKIEYAQTMTGIQYGEYSVTEEEWSALSGPTAPPVVTGIATDYTSSPFAWQGSLASELDASEHIFGESSLSSMFLGWRRRGYSGIGEHDLGGTPALTVGIKAIDADCAGFYLREDTTGSARTYGTIGTPTGPLTYAPTPTSTDLYFAWQRKTGDTAFSTSPICYV